MKRKRWIQILALGLMLTVIVLQGQICSKQLITLQEQKTQEEEAQEEEQTQTASEFDPWSTEKSCVRIQAGGHYGSGCIYEITRQTLLVVTNRHVLEYWDEESYVNLYDGTPCRGELFKLSEDADIGFLRIDVSSLEESVKKELESVKITDVTVQKGDAFYMIDMASDVYDKKLYQGQVLEERLYLAEFGMEMLYGESCFVEGMSGCGLFDLQGDYIGMLTGGTAQNEIAAILPEVLKKENPLT